MQDNLEKRVQRLEEMVSYQEQTIDSLNDVIIEQQTQLTELENQLERFLQALLTTKPENPAGDQDPPPPHY